MINIGIDIGGTSIKGAAVSDKNKIYDKFVLPINKDNDQTTIINDLIKIVEEYIANNKFEEPIYGIGIGIPGSIDSKNGVVTYSNNLVWEDLHIVDMFKKAFPNLPIKITNDANAAALGESYFGAGKKYKDMVMITLGTGVGSGIIANGQIYEGLNGKGAEIGHSSLYLDGIDCTCGRKGCFEMYASATALIRQTKEAMEKDKTSLLWKEAELEGKVGGRVPFNAAKKGDKTAQEVVDKYIYYLCEGLLNICNIFRPECIVLSGGIANQGDYLLDRIIPYLKKYQYGFPLSPATEVKIAELGYDSGIIGAACLLFDK